MFQVVLLLLCAFAVWRWLWPMPWPRVVRLALAAVLLLAANYHGLVWLAFGSRFSPEMAKPWVMLGGWAFACFVMLVMLTAVGEVLLGLMRLARRGRAVPQRMQARMRMALGAAAVCLSALGMWQAVQVPEVRRVAVALRGLPAAMDGMRVVQLTDLHLSRLLDDAWAEQVVARVNALAPDLVLITGDLIDGTPAARATDVAPLAKLRARLGVWVIPGNHEYYFEVQPWLEKFRQLGMRVLLNEHTVFGEPGTELVLAGVADEAALRFGEAAPDIAIALQNVPPAAPVILMAHRPADTEVHAAQGVGLQLSGHTHGGMVYGLDWLVARFNGGFVSGRYEVGDMLLYVSNGTGLWNGFAQRLGVPSEITEFTLYPAQPDGQNAFLPASG